MRAIVAVAAVDEPETAPKPALVNTVATASPPGKWPTHLLAARNISDEIRLADRISAIRMNKGIAVSSQEAVLRYGATERIPSARLSPPIR